MKCLFRQKIDWTNKWILIIQELYLQAGLATRASRLVKSDDILLSNPDIVERVSKALLRGEFYEQAGELFEKVDQEDQVKMDLIQITNNKTPR